MGTDPFFSWIVDPDPLLILLCDPFPDPNSHFVTRSFPDPTFLTRSLYYLYI